MSNIDLLSTVLPSEGYYCVAGLGGGRGMQQSFHETREEVDAKVTELVQNGRDVYFALARFETTESRTKDNVKLLRSFWLDLDCGEAKAVVNEKTGKPDGYIDQATAIQELVKFCELVGLPLPLFVNSGRGIHGYWPLNEDITRAQWEPVGKRLAQLCTTHKLYADPSVFEVARILRVPGTFNFKDNPPLPVEMITEDFTPMSYDEFRNILGVTEEAMAFERPEKREYTELGKMMQENVESSFSKIMRRSAEGKGCQQLVSCYNERASLSEPRWFNALSVAKFCKDADKAIHKMSSGHPDYDPTATIAKINHIKGPHTCVQFDKNNPGGCDGCPFKGKIGSPISLGKELIPCTEEIVITAQQIEEQIEQEVPEKEVAGVYKVPPYPEPFFRGKNGGIYFMPNDDEAEPMLVYEHDIYVVKRMEDPAQGEVFVVRRHLPRDGVKQFNIPNSHMVDKTELQKVVSKNGVICLGKPLDLLLRLLTTMAKDLQIKQRSEHMRLQFGWADNDSKFIIGDREITKDGVFHSPPSNITADIARHMHAKGTLEKWKEVFALYGRPGMEPNAFGALTAFGAPLLKFLGQKGSIINLIHSRSGTGKTTTLHMCNSVYGVPDRLYAVKDDTLNAKIMRLGIMNNLPFTADEMTNITAKDLSTLAYNMSQGRGKDRVKSQSNEMRLNVTSWQTMSLTSSNSSYYEKLSSEKSSPDGEMMRLLEYKIDYSHVIDPLFAKEMFDHQLMNNYGHAGEIYAKWLVGNLEEAKASVLSVQSKIDKELKLTQRERCWSAAVAANITGGLIARQLGLIDWDMKAIYKWTTQMIEGIRTEVVPSVTDVMMVIGDFLNRHIHNMLVVNDGVDRRSHLPTSPLQEPKGELIVRYEPDTKKMFISVKAFRDDCVKHQVNYAETTKELKKKGILLSTATKRLTKGMKVMAPGVYALALDTTHSEFLKLDGLVPVELPHASGEG
jgi:hypothetical protein